MWAYVKRARDHWRGLALGGAMTVAVAVIDRWGWWAAVVGVGEERLYIWPFVLVVTLIWAQYRVYLDVKRERDDLERQLKDLDRRRGIIESFGRQLRLGQIELSVIESAGEQYQKAMEEMKAAGKVDESRFHEFHEKVSAAGSDWEEKVSKSLDEWLDYSYRARFEDDSGLVPRNPPARLVDEWPIKRWQQHEMRLQRLHQIIQELHQKWEL
jgi:hypothetical protein